MSNIESQMCSTLTMTSLPPSVEKTLMESAALFERADAKGQEPGQLQEIVDSLKDQLQKELNERIEALKKEHQQEVFYYFIQKYWYIFWALFF